MTKRRLSRLALVLVALGAGLLAQPSPAGAASVSKSGWWYRTSQPTSALPAVAQPPGGIVPDNPTDPVAPPTVAEGSLLVEGTPEGATAIAGITYALTPGESSPTLTITPSSSSNTPDDSIILACAPSLQWTAPEPSPGRWQDKPLVDCNRSVNGILNADGTWTFALQPLIAYADATELDLVLVPGVVSTTPAGNVGSAFSLSFSVAEGAVLTSTPAPSAAASDQPPSSYTPTYTASPASSPSFTAAAPTFVAPSAPVVQPSLEPQDQAPAVPSQPLVAAPVAVKDDNTAQGVAFLILLAGAALAGLAYVTPTRAEDATVGLGRFRRPAPVEAIASALGPVQGGLGRFTRPRLGPPPKLS